MIPKIIHYCWFGGAKKTPLINRCIKSWKKHLPDYKIIEWNENNFDIKSIKFVREAYAAKKWAFIADYVRLYCIYNYGGIYIDSDVQLYKSLDPFLSYKGFSGFESQGYMVTGIMGGEKGNKTFEIFLSYYDNKPFIKKDLSHDMIANTEIITQQMKGIGFVQNNTFQVIDGFALFPTDYFCPIDLVNDTFVVTKNTVCVHFFAGSWIESFGRIKRRNRLNRDIQSMFGPKIYTFIKKIYKHLRFFQRK